MSTAASSSPAANGASSPSPAAAPAAGSTSPVVAATPAAASPAPAQTPAGVSAPVATPYASASLYVGDLAPDVTEALLFEIFNAVGPVASVRVCRDAATRRSLGYAYVNFHRVDDAERALDTMNFKNIRSRPCRIMWSHRDPSLRKSGLGNIFVNHLAKSIDNKQLYDTFSMFGNILSCKVAMNSKRESLGYGFVHYETDEAAANAIARVDGKVIGGEKVSVTAFKSKKERGGAKNERFTNVFCKNLPQDVTKEQVDELFAKYGKITSSVVTVDKESKQRAFCFVNFETPEQAAAAVEGLNNTEFQGKKLYVSRAQKRDEREKDLRERFEQLKAERAKKYAGVNLYVKNLSDDYDDKKLTEEFSKFGTITNAAIMVDPVTKKSRGFGFVCFSTPEEATKAVTEMNGRMVDGKPLYVALAQRKEQRRAQLEAQYAARAKMGGNMPMQAGIPYGANPMMFNPAAHHAAARGIPYQQPMNPMAAAAYPGMRGINMPQPYGQPNMMMRGPNPLMGNVNYQLMPANGRVGPQMNGQPGVARGQGQGPNAAGRNPRNQPPTGRPAPGAPLANAAMGVKGGLMPGQQLRYADNVRNRGVAPGMPGAAQGGVAETVSIPAAHEPLTIKALAAAPEEMRKQMIGERLFPLIKQQEPMLAGKITGMLLEMDNGELIHLLESQQALNEKIIEALQVLQAHPAQEAAAAQQQQQQIVNDTEA